MKILLLNDGGHVILKGIDFPVEVECELHEESKGAFVPYSEFVRIGSDRTSLVRRALYFSAVQGDFEYI